MKSDDEDDRSSAKLSENEPLSLWKNKLKREALSESVSVELKKSLKDEKLESTKAIKLKRKPPTNDVNSLSKEQTKKKKTINEKKETKVEKLQIVTKQDTKVRNLNFSGHKFVLNIFFNRRNVNLNGKSKINLLSNPQTT